VTPELQAVLKKLPDRPGVYLMKDARGSVLYVGKAASLRSRVRSYWQKEAPGLDYHLIRSVIDRVHDLEYTMTDSVGEALLLEGNLVKRFQPPFNVRLKDDKSYPYIKITLNDDFPRIERTRKLPNDGSRYFGPYASASSVDEAMNSSAGSFPFRTCTIDIKDGVRALQRPCLLYHIKRCQGPCIEAISKDAYRADIDQVQLFLEGRQESLVKALGETCSARPSARTTSRRRSTGTRSRRSSDDGEPEDGRVRSHRLWTSSASRVATTRRPCSCSSSAAGRRWAATSSCWTRRAARRCRRRLGLPAPVLRAGDERAGRDRDPARPAGRRGPGALPLRAAGLAGTLPEPDRESHRASP
jgi:hypothetical protein